MKPINVGLLGIGTVGGATFEVLARNQEEITRRAGRGIAIKMVADKDLDRARKLVREGAIITADANEVVGNPDIDIVIELIGGTRIARDLVMAAIKSGKHVVTANKALLANYGNEIFAAARKHGVMVAFEAAVAGGIPIIKVLREGLIGNRITRLYGIVNGTCNYILTRMKDEGADFAAVLADAQRLGYAETPPDLDIDCHDAAHKTGILASLAHGFWVNPKQIYTEGIRSLTKQDIEFARKLGYTIRLLGCVKANGASRGEGRGARAAKGRAGKLSPCAIQVSVYPALVPNSHVLANVNGVFNAVLVRGDVVGDTLYYGRGAGQDATASAVLSDLADAALDLKCGTKNRIPPFVPHERDGAVLPMEEVVSRYYVRLTVEDRPGVFAKIAGILAKANIGISSIIQPEGHDGVTVPVILMIHDAPNAAMRRALAHIAQLGVVKGEPVMIRVESFE